MNIELRSTFVGVISNLKIIFMFYKLKFISRK